MRKLKPVLLGIGILLILTSIALFFSGQFEPKGAGIKVETNPSATVSINGEQVGKTPYEGTRKPGEIIVKLVPEGQTKLMAPFETKVTLNPKIQTVVRRDFGETDETSSGEIISFEKIGGKEASISIVSMPDSAQVFIDGSARAFAPYKTSSLVAGEHQLVVSAPGYLEKTFSVRTMPGYNLTAVVKLAPTGEAVTPTPTPTPEAVKATVVEILSTPTGYLNVRATPSATGEFLFKAKPGEKYRYLDTDPVTGWFKIEYEEGKGGWISNKYGQKIEDYLLTPTPTPIESGPTPTVKSG